MSQCPVCQTEYIEGEAEYCPVCHWQLKQYSFLIGLLPEFLEQEKVKLEWARKLWAVLKLRSEQINQLQLQLKQVKQKEFHIQSQLEKANLERSHLQEQLESERLQLQAAVEQNTSPLLATRASSEFSFQVLTVDAYGQQIDRHSSQAKFFSEYLDDVSLETVFIAGGTFWMGSPVTEEGREINEEPQHQVTIKPFSMGKYLVTQAQWRAVAALPRIKRSLNPDPSYFKGADLPVEQVSWHDAIEFCARLTQKTGREYRLPSEAEWEYACRATTTTQFDFGKSFNVNYADELAILKAQTTTPFHFGETITPDIANYDGNYTYNSGPRGNYRQQTTPVGSFQVANSFGLYDLHGNVWEWCADTWHPSYQGAPKSGIAWKLDGDDSYRLLRGGSWYCLPRLCRSAQRHWDHPDNGGSGIGLRVACSFTNI